MKQLAVQETCICKKESFLFVYVLNLSSVAFRNPLQKIKRTVRCVNFTCKQISIATDIHSLSLSENENIVRWAKPIGLSQHCVYDLNITSFKLKSVIRVIHENHRLTLFTAQALPSFLNLSEFYSGCFSCGCFCVLSWIF